jgi:hypothetical protein
VGRTADGRGRAVSARKRRASWAGRWPVRDSTGLAKREGGKGAAGVGAGLCE